MMTRLQFIQRLEEIAQIKIQSKLRQHEECRAADDERQRIQLALTEAKDSYMQKYRQEMAAAQNRCADTCADIRRRERELQARLDTERLKLEAELSGHGGSTFCTQPDEEKGAAL